MGRGIPALLMVLSLAAAAASLPQLACCAGLVELHGAGFASCCESAGQDPGAEDCCDGTEAKQEPSPERQASLAALPVVARTLVLGAGREDTLPEPKLVGPVRILPLYTLHTSLLI